jgi:hypothetical protein
MLSASFHPTAGARVDRQAIEMPLAAVERGSLRTLLADSLALRVPGAVTRQAAARWAAGVMAGRKAWVSDFGGEQFTLGRAFYTHLEQRKSVDYFASAAASDAVVEKHCPGLQTAMLEWLEHLLGEPVRRRAGFCGPGVHVFPPRRAVSRRGGDTHFDLEGLTRSQIDTRTPAVTIVLMLSPPKRGGGLYVWDRLHRGFAIPPAELTARPCQLVRYEAGTLVAIDSYRLHRIERFAGSVPRISATCHAVRGDDSWQVWF